MGETSLLGGKRVAKYHQRIEAYGTIDELMAQTALLRDFVEDEGIREELIKVLDRLMASASIVAADGTNYPENMPEITDSDVSFLEKSIDLMDAELEPLTSFVLPGGHMAVSQSHVARTVCRRAERKVLQLADQEPVEKVLIRFFNRLSDYYFLLSRKLAKLYNIEQILWKP
jgi:cob(I)alamin adenosyltransferase